jgi:hypothetical protein
VNILTSEINMVRLYSRACIWLYKTLFCVVHRVKFKIGGRIEGEIESLLEIALHGFWLAAF